MSDWLAQAKQRSGREEQKSGKRALQVPLHKYMVNLPAMLKTKSVENPIPFQLNRTEKPLDQEV